MAAAASGPSVRGFVFPGRIGEEYTEERFHLQKELTIRLTNDVIIQLGQNLNASDRLKLRKQLLGSISDLTFERRSELRSYHQNIHSKVFRFVQSFFAPQKAHYALPHRFESEAQALYPYSQKKIFSGFTPVEFEQLIFRLTQFSALSQIVRIEEFRLLLLDPRDPQVKEVISNTSLENVLSALTVEGFVKRALVIARQFYVDLSELGHDELNLTWLNHRYERNLEVIIKALIKRKEFGQAEKHARSIQNKSTSLKILIILANALFDSGKKEGAIRLAEFIASDIQDLTPNGLQNLSKLYTKLGNIGMARSVGRVIAQNFLREKAGDECEEKLNSSDLFFPFRNQEIEGQVFGVTSLLEDQNFEGALLITKKIIDSDAKKRCYGLLIDAFIKIGAFQKALQIANILRSPTDSIKKILMAVAEVSSTEELLTLAETIEQQEIKTAAILAISLKLGESGDAEGANRLANSFMEAAFTDNKDKCVIS